jgi:hypothetical protein
MKKNSTSENVKRFFLNNGLPVKNCTEFRCPISGELMVNVFLKYNRVIGGFTCSRLVFVPTNQVCFLFLGCDFQGKVNKSAVEEYKQIRVTTGENL